MCRCCSTSMRPCVQVSVLQHFHVSMCPLHVSCNMIGFEFEWCGKTLACSHCAHMDAEYQRSFINCNSCVAPVPGEAHVLGMLGTFRSCSLSGLHDPLLHHSLDFLGEVGFQGFLVFLGSISRGRRFTWLPGSDFLG